MFVGLEAGGMGVMMGNCDGVVGWGERSGWEV